MAIDNAEAVKFCNEKARIAGVMMDFVLKTR